MFVQQGKNSTKPGAIAAPVEGCSRLRGVTRSRIPLNNERIYAPYKIAALVEVLAEQGIAPEVSLRGSGVPE